MYKLNSLLNFLKSNDPDASEGIQNLLKILEEREKEWENLWEDRERAINRKIETFQLISERTQIMRDIELLSKEIEHRKKNIGTNYEQVHRSIETFHDITENMNVSLL